MSSVLLNIFLALIWAASTGEVTLVNLSIGYALGFVILFLTRGAIGSSRYVDRITGLVSFIFFVIFHLIAANLRVVRDVLRPTHQLRPGIVRIPLEAQTDAEIILLANILSLMPGTFSLDVSDNREYLYVHAMHLPDRDAFEGWVKDSLEPRVLRVIR